MSASPIRTEANRKLQTGQLNTRTSLAWLRTDLSQVSGIREEFATGPNNFGVDVWVEGPVSPGGKSD